MKRIHVFAALLAAVLLVGVMPAMAADAAAFEVETVTAQAGDTVDVDIAVKNSPGVTSAKLRVAFDDVLTLERVTYGTAVTGIFIKPQKMTSPVVLIWTNGSEDFSGDYLFATLTFTVAEDAQAGTYPITVTYDPDDVHNIEEENVDFAVVNGGVEVSDNAYAVSDLRLDDNWLGEPVLLWTEPDTDAFLIYEVFGSTDGGATWCQLGGTSRYFLELRELFPITGVYNAIKVESALWDSVLFEPGEVLGECVADLSVTIQDEILPDAEVVLTPTADGSGGYDLLISGLTPSVKFDIHLSYSRYDEDFGAYIRYGENFKGTSDSEGTAAFEVNAELAASMLADEDSIYSVKEYSAALAEDKQSASVFISARGNGLVSDIIVDGECTHADKTEVPAVPADCETSGNNLYYHCAACGKTLKADGVTETTPEAEVTAALGHDFDNWAEDVTGMEVRECSRCDHFETRELTSVVASVGEVEFLSLNAAIKAAEKSGGTVVLQADAAITDAFIPKGVTLDLGGYTLTADYLIGVKGSYLTATPNAGKLIVEQGNLVLPEEGYISGTGKDGSIQYVLPIWDPENNCYLFSRFVVNTATDVRGLKIDEANEKIYFQFRHLATSALNTRLLADGAGDNALKVVVRLEWKNKFGEAYQDFVYNDEFVGAVTGGYDYSFTMTGYSTLGIDIDTLTVTAMIITDSGAAALGAVWNIGNAK